MDHIFIWVLNQSINAVYLLLAVLVIRLVVKRAPKWIICVLWGLVAWKLLMPFSFESALSLVPSREPIPKNIEFEENPHVETGIPFINSTVNPVIENRLSPNLMESVNPMQIVVFVCAYLWMAGILAMLAYFCVSCLVVKRRVAISRRLRDNIYIKEGLPSPFILGVVRPKIYIPTGLTGEALECILEHEMAHIRRLDHLWKPLGYLILTVYWFQPLCWISYILFCRDIELACDEKVIRDKDKEWKTKYCQTLLDCGTDGKKQRKIISACPIAFGEVSVKDRIKSVLNYKKPAFWVIIAAIAAGVAAIVCFATSPTSEKRKEQGASIREGTEAPAQTETPVQTEGLAQMEVPTLESLQEKFPEYFNLSTSKGLEVYVWQMAENNYSFGVMEGTNRNKTEEELMALKTARLEEMKLILSTYDIPDSDIFVIPYRNPISSYLYWIEDERAYIRNVRELLGLDNADNITTLSSEEYAIRLAILSHNRRTEGATGIYPCASFLTLDQEFNKASQGQNADTVVTYYGWALYEEYMPSGIRLANVSGSHIPVVMSFNINENGEYSLAEYWEPRDGAYFASDIREKVPAKIYEDMIDSQKFILRQKQDCFAQMVETCGIDTDMAMEGLLGIVTESPASSSNPRDYIEAHPEEYREMTYYGTYALKYCFSRFEKGGETGLEGQIMKRVCEDIFYSLAETPAGDKAPFDTGQEWYDFIEVYARGLKAQDVPIGIAEKYPASYLLLEMLGEI